MVVSGQGTLILQLLTTARATTSPVASRLAVREVAAVECGAWSLYVQTLPEPVCGLYLVSLGIFFLWRYVGSW